MAILTDMELSARARWEKQVLPVLQEIRNLANEIVVTGQSRYIEVVTNNGISVDVTEEKRAEQVKKYTDFLVKIKEKVTLL